MTLEFEVDVDYLTDGGTKDMPTWVKLNDEDGERTSTVYVNTSSYWHVVDENAKLRELVRDLWPFVKADWIHACPNRECHLFEECDVDSEYECLIEEHMAGRMRELGMEVD